MVLVGDRISKLKGLDLDVTEGSETIVNDIEAFEKRSDRRTAPFVYLCAKNRIESSEFGKIILTRRAQESR